MYYIYSIYVYVNEYMCKNLYLAFWPFYEYVFDALLLTDKDDFVKNEYINICI